ncbi:MAG: glycosyltransferase family 2 protein [Candidatus Thiodiazotropha sp. (ex Gloverina cf. vestifex)]|nr:glycosyltransferase family 2 protein [Candidatus Thiodiazotropha sp. (ex Gloverina cf. vestifex)]
MHSAVIVVNWNSWAVLDQCLEALDKQSLPFHRILVIDNGSSEPMPESFLRWQAREDVEYKTLTANTGFAMANNIGLGTVADCSWVALVNPDAFLDSAWHEQMRRASEAYPAAASFSSALVKADDHAFWDGLGDVYHASGLVWRSAHGHLRISRPKAEESIFSPCAAAGFYRHQALQEVGGFDDDYFCYVEDVDLGFRLQLMGYSSILIPTAIAYHVGSATTGGKHSDFAVYHGHRNLAWTFVKDMPGSLFWLLLPLHVMMNFAALARFTLRGQGKVIFKAKWDAIKGLPHIIRKRKSVQSTRRCSIVDIWRMLDKRLFIGK